MQGHEDYRSLLSFHGPQTEEGGTGPGKDAVDRGKGDGKEVESADRGKRKREPVKLERFARSNSTRGSEKSD